ncbi:LOW QUALITY PROTEIN: cyclic AMP-dependent transcription factor ATF-4 [Myxocyprinus asiaticus]|uniref:LOW QUALITY PROTEIN: cyclic AMP-dependent transcription factor ATF-4 n=1 Tax=Myxocyprinus asiaticus TaxID=70543 RepID=UPI00222324BB|nr:LOW QUALITY PROTEIN: cyclic AMP-dependent transcription factor ATF-4 [Myxocyprinus asiaticus]
MSLMFPMCLEDVGSLLLGPSSLMADPFGPLLDDDEESALSEGSSSPLSSSYADSSSLSPLSPCPHASVGCKSDLLSLSWLPASELLGAQTEPEQKHGEAFSGMDWMNEKLDLSDFDLDSLIGSCDSDEPPNSPEELLACLDTEMDLDLDSLPFSSSEPVLTLPTLPLELPLSEPTTEPEKPAELESVEIKSEPPSPVPSLDSPVSSPYTLELGSMLDVSVVKSSTVLQSSGIMLNLSPSHILVVLTPEEEVSTGDSSDSDSGISVSGSPVHQQEPAPSPKPEGSSRTKPYSKPNPDTAPVVTGRVKTASGAPKVVEKKLKKMEQNKTAATRYRQKKRVEQESLNAECEELEKRNRELSDKADSISREIQYLKGLMEEVRSAKNRKKSKVSSA